MLAKIKSIDFNSLNTIIFVGLIVRLIAVIFSEGYGMHDDHYLVIEAAGSWVDGYDYNDWLPWNDPIKTPEGHSFTYVGLNFLFISLLKFIGIADPKMIMLFNRLVHALFSLIVIKYGFLITEKLKDRKTAVIVGWILACLWAMPWLSVRNLVEVVSIPFLIIGVWLTMSSEKKSAFFIAGLLIGMAVSFRYQIAIFVIGMGLYFLIKLEIKKLIFLAFGTIVTFLITQGLVDYLIWGYPFAEFMGYVSYNSKEGVNYLPNSNYFMYFYVLFGVLLFPLAIFGLVGFFKTAKKYWILFLPTCLFLVFHSLFPNRQERFILSILPFVIILSIIGIQELRIQKFWDKLWKPTWVAFWVLNIPLLLIFSTTTSKQSRLNTMYALYGNTKGNEHILIEATGETNSEMMPFFYAGNWDFKMSDRSREDTTKLENYLTNPHQIIFFFGVDSLSYRIRSMKRIYPQMSLMRKIQPSLIDKILFKINKRNSNSYVEVWKTNYLKK